MNSGGAIFYSADRRGFYGRGQLMLQKEPYDDALNFLSSPRGNFSAEDNRQHLLSLFPDGLSLHGWDFALRRSTVPLSNGAVLLDPSCVVEMMFEYVRRASFPELPARFQSFFAFNNLEDVKAFANQLPIYQVTSTNVFKFDQNWLTTGDQISMIYYNADRYWSGAATPMPKWEYLLVPPVTAVPVSEV